MAPSRLAMPGSTFASCTTIGTLAAPGRQVGGRGHVPAEPDQHLGPGPVQHLVTALTASASRPGTDSSSGATVRGSGTGGISARS